MAKNKAVYRQGLTIAAIVSHPSSPASGDPVRYGQVCGVALTAKNTTDNVTVFDIGPSIYRISVKAVDGGGNSAVAEGDKLYYVDNDTPPVSKKTTGVFFGIAHGSITAGQTATIPVILRGA